MPEYEVFHEVTIVKQAKVRVKAPNVAEAIKEAELRVKAGDVDWGNAEIGQTFVDIVEVQDAAAITRR